MSTHPNGVTLSDFASGDCSAPITAEVQRHLETCARCSAEVGDYIAIRRLATTPAARPSSDVWPAVSNNIARRSTRPVVRPRRRGGWWAIAASVALLAGSVALVQLTAGDNRDDRGAGPSAGADAVSLAAGSEETRRIDLVMAEVDLVLARVLDLETDNPSHEALRASLQAIDQRVVEANRVLQQDPDSELARIHLNRLLHFKLSLLRDAAWKSMPAAPIG